jgi:hypothetical protein
MTASTFGSLTSARQSCVERAKPYARALSAAPSGVVVEIISSRGRSAVLNTAPAAAIATECALPI